MIIDEGYWLIAFDSTHHALAAEALLDAANMESDIRPTPKSITAGCALSIDFRPEDLPQIVVLLRENGIAIRGYYQPVDDIYVQIEPDTPPKIT